MRLFYAPLLLLALGSCQPVDFQYADGSPGRFADWAGHWVVINYWAEWCAPCRLEIPQLNELHRALGGDEALVVGVNYDAVAGDALTALIQRMGINFPVMTLDPRARFGYDLPTVLPTTVIIGPSGVVLETLVGPQTEASIKAVVGVSASL